MWCDSAYSDDVTVAHAGAKQAGHPDVADASAYSQARQTRRRADGGSGGVAEEGVASPHIHLTPGVDTHGMGRADADVCDRFTRQGVDFVGGEHHVIDDVTMPQQPRPRPTPRDHCSHVRGRGRKRKRERERGREGERGRERERESGGEREIAFCDVIKSRDSHECEAHIDCGDNFADIFVTQRYIYFRLSHKGQLPILRDNLL